MTSEKSRRAHHFGTIVADRQQALPDPATVLWDGDTGTAAFSRQQKNSRGVGVGLVSFCTETSKDPGKGTPLYFTTTHLSSKKCGK